MGIRFACTSCGHVLNVKEHLAGKRGVCPKCQGRIDIPYASTAGASGIGKHGSAARTPPAPPTTDPRPTHDPIAEAPHLNWYVLPPGATSNYGPAPGETMLAWILQGRVSADSMVWRQDWPDWRKASDVLPQLQGPSNGAAAPGGAAITPPARVAPPLPSLGTSPAAKPQPGPTYAAQPAVAQVPVQAAVATPVANDYQAFAQAPSAGSTWTNPVSPAPGSSFVPRQRRKSGLGTSIAISVLLAVIIGISPLVVWIITKQ